VSRIRRDVVVIVVSLAVLAVCAVVAADGQVGPVERALFHAVNGLPSWLYRPMLLFQYLGVLAMPLVVAAGALALRRWRLAAALVLVVPLKLALERVVACRINASSTRRIPSGGGRTRRPGSGQGVTSGLTVARAATVMRRPGVGHLGSGWSRPGVATTHSSRCRPGSAAPR
jgi:hypothetical protein